MNFTHLHLHTQYSLLDGAILIDKLIPRLKDMGMISCAITDHGSMYGVVDFYKQCTKAGIKPIIGCEFYISPTTRFEREYTRGQVSNYHLILLAENDIGFANLRILATKAQLEGFYFRPRIDKELLEAHSEGIIALSACLGGEIPRRIMTAGYADARDAALEYERIMGKGNFFLELQHNGIPEQDVVNAGLLNIAEETGIPLVGTCDCHYLNKGEHDSHEVLMCVQMQAVLGNGRHMETASEELYVKSPEEMVAAFAKTPEAIENTQKIADRCNVTMEFVKEGQGHMPIYEVPQGFTQDSYMTHIAEDGLKTRLQDVPESEHESYHKRLAAELTVIRQKGYVSYFLIVWDFINYAREQGIRVGPGRGSGAGSLVAYSMRITDVDPMKMKLFFERFLNPERPSMPDFDIDFCVRRRGEVIDYVSKKYGADHVSQISTFGKLSGRGIVKDVCRVLDIPLDIAGKFSNMIPSTPGMTFSKALKENPDIAKAFLTIDKGEDLLKHCTNLEGLLRQSGMHAAGIVITDKPIVEYAPLARGKDGEVIVQYEMKLLEDIGLVKYDFLGLANLTIIDEALDRIRRQVDPNFDLAKIPYDDKAVYDMLSRGESTGVFQFESDGMRRLMKKLQPSVLEDLIALNALYRPGPINGGVLDDFCDRKHGIQKIVYALPELEPILKETYGIIVYQEQVMEISRAVAGYSLGAADLLRRAMGKKKVEEMAVQKRIFIDGDEAKGIAGARKLGFNVKTAGEIFDLMEKFAEYGFNKSHSAAYAVVAYQTAYLRCKYPAQFLSACMSSEQATTESLVLYIEDARGVGLDVRTPDINKSGVQFDYNEDAIWFGLRSVKGVGEKAANAIVEERVKHGAYKSFYNFCDRIDLHTANKKALEALIYAGAFDCFGKRRSQLLAVLESCMEQGQRKQKMKEHGIQSIEDFLFADEEEQDSVDDEFYPDTPELPDRELLSQEKAMLSMYFSSHPVLEAEKLSNKSFGTTAGALKSNDGDELTVLAMIKSVKKLRTNKNNENKPSEDMAVLVLEDMVGTVEAVAFPRTYKAYLSKMEAEQVVVVEGKWSVRGDRASIQINDIYTLEEALERCTKGLELSMELSALSLTEVDTLYKLVSQYTGSMPLRLKISNKDYSLDIPLASKFSIKPSEDFLNHMKRQYGAGCCRVLADERYADKYNFEPYYTEMDYAEMIEEA
ncbi:MAG: DNA polymerase III subunit alpha [Deferribacteraceae bacterium]|jgi:DNA polymerase-3 subunit alpha|nr:DNA polymerase III subunit alpha [Deferribacteraceae bacterium]